LIYETVPSSTIDKHDQFTSGPSIQIELLCVSLFFGDMTEYTANIQKAIMGSG
jgi:hypothetical protein